MPSSSPLVFPSYILLFHRSVKEDLASFEENRVNLGPQMGEKRFFS